MDSHQYSFTSLFMFLGLSSVLLLAVFMVAMQSAGIPVFDLFGEVWQVFSNPVGL